MFQKRSRLFLSIIISMSGLSFSANADVPTFDNINATQLETIIEEFGSAFSHTSVSSASSLGKIFGIEAAIVAGAVQSDGIKDIVNSVSPGTDFGAVPHASLIAGVSLPFGLGAEISFIPEFELADVELSRTGLAFKWTLTEGWISLPIDLALKAHYTDSKLGFSQSSPTADVDFEAQIMGAQLIISKDLLIVEPYAGIGFVKVDGKISSTVSIFDNSLTTGTSAENSPSGIEYFAGVQANLLIFRAAAEYGKILDNEKFSIKFGLKF